VLTKSITLWKLGYINKMNWNILVILGKKIKRDSIKNVNQNRIAIKVKRSICLNKGAPSSKAKYSL
jgi:hypothetical protein